MKSMPVITQPFVDKCKIKWMWQTRYFLLSSSYFTKLLSTFCKILPRHNYFKIGKMALLTMTLQPNIPRYFISWEYLSIRGQLLKLSTSCAHQRMYSHNGYEYLRNWPISLQWRAINTYVAKVLSASSKKGHT